MHVNPIWPIFACLFAIGAAYLQAWADFGLSPAAFAAQGDSTLKVAGYAFSIWGVLYLGMLVFAIYQARAKVDASGLLRRCRTAGGIAMAGCGLWIFAAAANQSWTTITLLFLSAAVLIDALVKRPGSLSSIQRWCVVAPLSLLAGWLTLAAFINLATVLTMNGMIVENAAPAFAMSALLSAAMIGLAATYWTNTLFALPMIWGLIGVYMAERVRQPEIAVLAVCLAAVMAAAIALMHYNSLRRAAPDVE